MRHDWYYVIRNAGNKSLYDSEGGYRSRYSCFKHNCVIRGRGEMRHGSCEEHSPVVELLELGDTWRLIVVHADGDRECICFARKANGIIKGLGAR